MRLTLSITWLSVDARCVVREAGEQPELSDASAKLVCNTEGIEVRLVTTLILLAIALPAATVLAASDQLNSDSAQWTNDEVYRVLNNSAWTRPIKMNFPTVGIDSLGRQSAPGEANPVNNAPMTGMSRRGGMGGGRSQATYSSGSGGRASTSDSSKPGPTEVLVQWQSDLVVRLAMAKKYGGTAEATKPNDEYVIGLVGLPMTAIGGRAAWADSEKPSAEDDQRIENHVKASASLLRSGHAPIAPIKVELDQGRDGRLLIRFPKSDPIEAKDKSVEFRLVMGKTELRKKFVLKAMEYQGKLDL